ncbi:hypothetical protein WJX73_004279 [Symbiochloris irregularis]|uniref:Formate/nitrite transporter n=1 Tax=Symbiochloris irregularis TaxID=706552 RepID=A0AAW1PE57_9CHLO
MTRSVQHWFVHKGAYDGDLKASPATYRRAAAAAAVPRTPTLGCLSPAATYAAIVEIGAHKARTPFWKTFLLGILGGFYISLGGALAYAIGGQLPEILQTDPGLQKLIFACFGLPMSLMLILIAGADLYTFNAACVPAALYEGRANIIQLVSNFIFSFFGNIVGCLIIVWLLDETYIFASPAAKTFPFLQGRQKSYNAWGTEVVRGMFANYLVCLAAWQATAAQDIIGKIFAIFFPVVAFVGTGYSHVIANAFWIPFSIKLGSGIPVGHYIVHSMIPDWLGNTLVAAFVLAGGYALLYGSLGDTINAGYQRILGRSNGSSSDGDYTTDDSRDLGRPDHLSPVIVEESGPKSV